ncbi:hypothetical protein BS47DRAFT_1373747 [Hydnum rufescens UP504]|uniref:Helitron helicase-like domain-containing protein n=1 Tax=Hydnum rufescens UP504 TaxID=1448309 RepID=A0A9P6ANE8_9AGAM|nr:hypothetical protein BS47DRAFT_1373747 [Hydnum rufescens UP504]
MACCPASLRISKSQSKGGYAVCHGRKPVSDFGSSHQEHEHNASQFHNFWALASPCLFPYGEGGLEAEQSIQVPFSEHTHNSFPFALSSAWLQIGHQDFESDMAQIHTLTSGDLEKAAKEEEHKQPVSNPGVGCIMGTDQSRTAIRSKVWSTTLMHGPPTLWITLNPFFAGADIDMDSFNQLTIANDPYAAAKFFHFIIQTTLQTLF